MNLTDSKSRSAHGWLCLPSAGCTLCFLALLVIAVQSVPGADGSAQRSVLGVCPPFFLKDEDGKVINPIRGENADKPYSPAQTCGACHDYQKITQGFHFMQGKGEAPTADQAARCQWASTPGNYGGTWCSPAPLYQYLSPQVNATSRTMDMTSFSFITAGCGACHPGGGSAEFDRSGRRYDRWMSDPASGLAPGGANHLDGDYYQARWSETGVLEADCLLCHLPEYNFAERKKQMGALNFRWAPTAAAGFAIVAGSVASGEPVKVVYDTKQFNPDGTVSPHIVLEPRNEACLECHEQPGWKKRGANFRPRTDVHLRAGLKCVDCHPAGSRADDSRINAREEHQFGKGDDPGGHVRDDLDNTCLDCASCHSTGYLGAPIARHPALPPIHLDRIACQTCHIPERVVKPIQFQASDVFSPGTKIPSKGKHLWTFYGPDGAYRNHYGYLTMMGFDDKPTEPFRPILARYKGKIYPVNRVHTAWPGIEIEGKPGLMQPKMSDIYAMWTSHQKDPKQYPELSKITDDNGDGVIEVNRPEEIDALIASVSAMLRATNYPMEGKRVVWVFNDRIYSSGNQYRTIEKHPWEASPYGNVHKYNHDVYPANAALGAKGCSDCHGRGSLFFAGPVLLYPFATDDARPVWVPNHEILSISSLSVQLGAFREDLLRPAAVWVILGWTVLLLLHYAVFGPRGVPVPLGDEETAVTRFALFERMGHFILMVPFVGLCLTGVLYLLAHWFPVGGFGRNAHAVLGIIFILGLLTALILWFRDMLFQREDRIWLRVLGGYFGGTKDLWTGKFNAGQKVYYWTVLLSGFVLAATGITMLVGRSRPEKNLSIFYTIHDLAALVLILMVIAHMYLSLLANPGCFRSIFGGLVPRRWLAMHHPGVLEEKTTEENKKRGPALHGPDPEN